MYAAVYAAPETDLSGKAIAESSQTDTKIKSENEEKTPEYYFDVQLVEPYGKENVKYFGNSVVTVNDNGKSTELKITKDVEWEGELDKNNCFKQGGEYTAVITFEADVEKILGIDNIDPDDFDITMPDRFEYVDFKEKEDNVYELKVSLSVIKMPVSKDEKHKHDKPLTENEIGKKSAGCETEGYQIYDCQCGYREIKDIAALGHEMQDNGSAAATCEKDGVKKEKCTRCSKTNETQISAIGHNWQYTYTDKPGCDYNGADHYTCANCKQTWDDVLYATGHNWQGVADLPALCESDGEQVYECTKCHANYSEIIPATGHSWIRTGGGAADCENYGTYWYTCENPTCTAEYTEYIEPLGHDMYSTYDYYGHWDECARCGTTYGYDAHSYTVINYGDHYEYYCGCGYFYSVWD